MRLEVRRTRDSYDVRSEPNWPLQNALYTTLFLDARSRMLTAIPPTEEGSVQYDPNRQGSSGRVSFVHRFVRYNEITGGMTLKLWVSTSNGEDLDLFVLLRKFDADGLETFFYGYNGFAKDGVAKGWLRVSHRELDFERSRPGRPWHTHRQRLPVRPGEITPVEIEILPSSTFFEAASSLRLDVLGRDAAGYPSVQARAEHQPRSPRRAHRRSLSIGVASSPRRSTCSVSPLTRANSDHHPASGKAKEPSPAIRAR